MTTGQEYAQGAYHLRWEGNLLHMRHVGDATTEDVVWVGDHALAQAKRVGGLYILVDQSCAGATPAEGRRRLSEHPSIACVRAIALFGGSRISQAVATLALRAMMLLTNRTFHIRFFADRTMARAWLDELRAKQGPIAG